MFYLSSNDKDQTGRACFFLFFFESELGFSSHDNDNAEMEPGSRRHAFIWCLCCGYDEHYEAGLFKSSSKQRCLI